MQRGEVDGQVFGFSSLKAGQPALWREHLVRPPVQFARATRRLSPMSPVYTPAGGGR